MPVPLSNLLKPVLPLTVEWFRDFPFQPDFVQTTAGAVAADGSVPREELATLWPRFEPVPAALTASFWMAVDDPRFERLVPKLDSFDATFRGIAYEGAGMGLMVLDSLLPYTKRLPRFLAGPGAPYRKLVMVGAGVTLPRLPVDAQRFAARQGGFDRWFVLDGYGFFAGFFGWRGSIGRQARPRRFRGYALRAFDQGLGRSLWFSTTAKVDRITATIDRFPPSRRSDLWSGVGLACAYATDVADGETIGRLVSDAGPDGSHVAAGMAVAAVLRAESGHPARHTDLACEVVWGSDTDTVARTAAAARTGVHDDARAPAYETWRERLRCRWAELDQLGTPNAGSER